MKDKKENWEKEFKKLFPDLFIKRTGEPYKDNLGGISNTYEKEISWEVKSFISQLLKDQREELKKEVERMGKIANQAILRMQLVAVEACGRLKDDEGVRIANDIRGKYEDLKTKFNLKE